MKTVVTNNLDKKPLGIIAAGFLITVCCVWMIALSLVNLSNAQHIRPDTGSVSAYAAGEQHVITIAVIILYVPLLVSGIGIIRLKEWARKLLVIMLIIGVSLSLCYKIVSQHNIHQRNVSEWILYVMCAIIFFFFTSPDVKKKFR